MWKDFFAFSRKEQKGIFLLSIIIILLVAFRLLSPLFLPSGNIKVERLDSLFALSRDVKYNNNSSHFIDIENIPIFNPNEITIDFLTDIGVNERIAGSWYNYISKGGRFSNPNDVGKIYGMDSITLNYLLPFMEIDKKNVFTRPEITKNDNIIRNFSVDLNRNDQSLLTQLGWEQPMIDSLLMWSKTLWISQRYNTTALSEWNIDSLMALKILMQPKYQQKLADDFAIEINRADTEEFMLLKGIGTVLSKRIIDYRNKLGGFVSPRQLSEVYGISPVLLEDITPSLIVDTLNIIPLNVNTASVSRLRNHPYLDFYKARDIVEKRKKTPFKNINEVFELESFSDANYEIIRHYLSVE